MKRKIQFASPELLTVLLLLIKLLLKLIYISNVLHLPPKVTDLESDRRWLLAVNVVLIEP